MLKKAYCLIPAVARPIEWHFTVAASTACIIADLRPLLSKISTAVIVAPPEKKIDNTN